LVDIILQIEGADKWYKINLSGTIISIMYPQQQGYFGGGSTMQSASTKKSKRRLILIISAVVLVVLAGIVAGISTQAKSPDQKFAAGFVKAYIAGDSKTAFAMLDPDTAALEKGGKWDTKMSQAVAVFKPGAKYDSSEKVSADIPSSPTIQYFKVKGVDATYRFSILVTTNGKIRRVKSFSSTAQ
jgi:hypothetical protein